MMNDDVWKNPWSLAGEGREWKKGSTRDVRFFIHGRETYTRWNSKEMDEKSIWRESFRNSPPLGNENDEQSLDVY